MQVKDVMTRTVNVISPDATLRDAATKMKRFDVGALPVCDGGRLVGMITDRDIVVRALADDAHSPEAKVVSIMTPAVVFCYENQDVDTVGELMGRSRFAECLFLIASSGWSGLCLSEISRLKEINARGGRSSRTNSGTHSFSANPGGGLNFYWLFGIVSEIREACLNALAMYTLSPQILPSTFPVMSNR